jgi:diadenosine tetraphosphate (Ap4A) HIT family hydrolase
MTLTVRDFCYISTVICLACYVCFYFKLTNWGQLQCEQQLDADDLLREWERMINQGFITPGHKIFRDNFTDIEFKDLGSGFRAQYSNAHSTKKVYHLQKEGAPDTRVRRPFNAGKFNFNKASADERLAIVDWRSDALDEKRFLACEDATDKDATDKHAIFVNLSPLTRGHFLFVPQPNKQFPQVLTHPVLELGLDLTSLIQRSRSDFRVLFNSLGAFASVNHLHLQGIFLDGLYPDAAFPVEVRAKHTQKTPFHDIYQHCS